MVAAERTARGGAASRPWRCYEPALGAAVSRRRSCCLRQEVLLPTTACGAASSKRPCYHRQTQCYELPTTMLLQSTHRCYRSRYNQRHAMPTSDGLRAADGGATSSPRRCFQLRLPALLPRHDSVASSGCRRFSIARRRCYQRLTAVLAAATCIASKARRRCFQRLPSLLPWHGGVAASGLRQCCGGASSDYRCCFQGTAALLPRLQSLLHGTAALLPAGGGAAEADGATASGEVALGRFPEGVQALCVWVRDGEFLPWWGCARGQPGQSGPIRLDRALRSDGCRDGGSERGILRRTRRAVCVNLILPCVGLE